MDSVIAIRGRDVREDEKETWDWEWLAKKKNSPDFPTIIDASDSSSGPIDQPTMAPSLSPTSRPTKDSRPLSTSEMSAEERAACEAAANGEVYTTKDSVIVRYIYELLYPTDRKAIDVALSVDKRVQALLLDELLDCDGPNPISNVAGVGPGGDADAIIKESCSKLMPEGAQACHMMAGSVTLYLQESKRESNSEEEPYDPVTEKLRHAFNGARRKLQARLVDEKLGILRLYYVGDYVYKDHESNTSSGVEHTPPVVSSNLSDSNQVAKSSTALIPVVVTASVMALVFAAFFVVRRVKSNTRSKGVLLGDEESSATSGSQDDQWKKSKHSLRISVVDTADETDSTASWGPVLAAHERVMEDFSGIAASESISSDLSSPYSRPVFIDPNKVTYYGRTKARYSFERDYSAMDTVEI